MRVVTAGSETRNTRTRTRHPWRLVRRNWNGKLWPRDPTDVRAIAARRSGAVESVAENLRSVESRMTDDRGGDAPPPQVDEAPEGPEGSCGDRDVPTLDDVAQAEARTGDSQTDPPAAQVPPE